MQVGLGLFATDEDGLDPARCRTSSATIRRAILAERHEQVFWILVGLIGLHVAAILYYLIVRRDNLVTPMVTGRREAPRAARRMIAAPLWRFLLAAALRRPHLIVSQLLVSSRSFSPCFTVLGS